MLYSYLYFIHTPKLQKI